MNGGRLPDAGRAEVGPIANWGPRDRSVARRFLRQPQNHRLMTVPMAAKHRLVTVDQHSAPASGSAAARRKHRLVTVEPSSAAPPRRPGLQIQRARSPLSVRAL